MPPKTKKPKRPPPKQRRRAEDDQAGPSTNPANKRLLLTSLPIEILAEILIRTCSPPTVLAVSRTCSFLYRTLALNPAVSFIWRSVRNTCEPCPLPEPEARGWKMDEAKYAALVFGSGICEVCGKNTREMYVSFATRIRLCGSWHCRRKFHDERLVSTSLSAEDRKRLWVPCVESNMCFRSPPLISTWPQRNHTLLLRKSDFLRFQFELARYHAAEEAQAMRELSGGPSLLSEGVVFNPDVMERCNAAMQRVPLIMELSVKLAQWKFLYDRARKTIKRRNDLWTKTLAEGEGWDLADLVASQAYRSMQRRKNFLLEAITSNDVTSIHPEIESELLAMQARHKRQTAEASHKGSMSELKKIYERMRCGMTEGQDLNDPLILPTLSVFFTFPSVRVLKGSPDPSVPNSTPTTGDIEWSPLATSLIKADIHTWLVPVEKHLMRLLGYPNGWQSASTRILPPLKRVTARFFCRRCGEGKVGKGYRRERCLDFKGVCAHVCVARTGKKAEGEQGPQEGETTNSGAEGGQEKGKNRKNRGGVKPLDWTVDIFEKDDKAIRLIQTILGLTGLSEEDSCTASELQAKGGVLRCTTCTGWVVMDFDTAIGHAHRHESMQIQLLPVADTADVIQLRDTVKAPLVSSRFAFERGNIELLLGSSFRAQRLSKKVNYGCRHCVLVENLPIVDVTGKGGKAMIFNGLRSHAKEKHGILDMGDEDFFCYVCIQQDEESDS